MSEKQESSISKLSVKTESLQDYWQSNSIQLIFRAVTNTIKRYMLANITRHFLDSVIYLYCQIDLQKKYRYPRIFSRIQISKM